MTLFSHKNAELEELTMAFDRKTLATKNDIQRLNAILENLTAETCPLSPCDDCLMIRCMLRRTN